MKLVARIDSRSNLCCAELAVEVGVSRWDWRWRRWWTGVDWPWSSWRPPRLRLKIEFHLLVFDWWCCPKSKQRLTASIKVGSLRTTGVLCLYFSKATVKVGKETMRKPENTQLRSDPTCCFFYDGPGLFQTVDDGGGGDPHRQTLEPVWSEEKLHQCVGQGKK